MPWGLLIILRVSYPCAFTFAVFLCELLCWWHGGVVAGQHGVGCTIWCLQLFNDVLERVCVNVYFVSIRKCSADCVYIIIIAANTSVTPHDPCRRVFRTHTT